MGAAMQHGIDGLLQLWDTHMVRTRRHNKGVPRQLRAQRQHPGPRTPLPGLAGTAPSATGRGGGPRRAISGLSRADLGEHLALEQQGLKHVASRRAHVGDWVARELQQERRLRATRRRRQYVACKCAHSHFFTCGTRASTSAHVSA